MAGFHGDHMMILADEAPGVPDPSMEVIRAACTGFENIILGMGNPTLISGWFADAFKPGSKWKNLHFDSEDSPIVDKGWVEEMAEKWGRDSDVFRVRVKGEFPKGNPKSFIQLADVSAAMLREGHPPGAGEEFCLGVDPARYGDDLTVLGTCTQNFLFPLVTMAKSSAVDVAQKVLEIVRIYRKKLKYEGTVKVKIDSGGFGAGVVDILRDWDIEKLDIIEINFGGESNKDYANTVSIMWGEFRDLLPTLTLPEDDHLLAELSTRRWKIQGKGKVIIEPKSDFKKEYKQSPDRADAVILAFTKADFQRKIIEKVFSDNSFKVNLNKLGPNSTPIIGFWVEDNLMTYVLACMWNSELGKLFVYGEWLFTSPSAVQVLPEMGAWLKWYGQNGGMRINDFTWYGNWHGSTSKEKEIVGSDIKMGYINYSVNILETRKYSDAGSAARANLLVKAKKLIISDQNKKLLVDLDSWLAGMKNLPSKGFGFARCLCLVVSMIGERNKYYVEQPKLKAYSPASDRFQRMAKDAIDSGLQDSFDRKQMGSMDGNVNDWMIF